VRIVLLSLVISTVLSCGSSQGMQQDVGAATVTEDQSDVSGCEYVAKVAASADIRSVDGDRARAMDLAFDRLRNDALHKRCDTVYLMSVVETTTHIEMTGEGYRCELPGITDAPGSGQVP
jgi:hypothetical protein